MLALLGESRVRLLVHVVEDADGLARDRADPHDGGMRTLLTATPPADTMPRRLARVGLGLALLFAGISHLTFARDEFKAQVPSWFPAKDFTVLASGAVEIALGTEAENLDRIDKVLEQFQRFCTVSESVKAGIPVTVSVSDGTGRRLT